MALTEEQQEVIDLLCGELAEAGEALAAAGDAWQDLLEDAGLRLEPIGSAAELAGLTGLASASLRLRENLSQLRGEQNEVPEVLHQPLRSWSGVWLAYLQNLGGDDEAKTAAALVDYLALGGWPVPLSATAQTELFKQFQESGLNLPDDDAPLPQSATAEMLSLVVGEDVRPELLEGMLIELPQQVRQFETSVAEFLRSRQIDDLAQARRLAHTLKGAAHIVGVQGIANLMHCTEDILETVAKGRAQLPAGFNDLLLDVSDTLAAMGEYLCGVGPAPDDSQSVLQAVLDCVRELKQKPGAEQTLVPPPAVPVDAAVSEPKADDELLLDLSDSELSAELLGEDDFEFDFDAIVAEDTPSAESVDTPSAEPALATPELTNVEPQPEKAAPAEAEEEQRHLTITEATAQELLRIAGEAQITNAQIAAQVDAMNMGVQSTDRYHQQLKQMASEMEVLVQTQSALRAASMHYAEGELDPIELERYSELHTFSHQLMELTTDAAEAIAHIGDQLRELSGITYAQRQLNKDNQNLLLHLRMVPVELLASRFSRCVRQACRLTGKAARLEIHGGRVLVDSLVLNRVVDPVLHLLRNAVDHGLEDSAEAREAEGKSGEGLIHLTFEQHGETLTVRVEDDGRGLNYDQIKTKALASGIVTEEQADDPRALEQVILLPGFTTRASASQTSGRGIGLDAVVSEVKGLKGSISVSSTPGAGCCFTLSLPTSILTGHALLVRCGTPNESQTLSVVTRNLEQIVYVKRDELHSDDGRLWFQQEDERLAVYPLHDLVNLYAQPSEECGALLITQRPGGEKLAVAVEAVVASQDLVIKPLNRFAHHPPGVVGATILGDGTVSPVIDLQELPGIAFAQDELAIGRARKRLPVVQANIPSALIVDDSLSARRSLAQFVTDMGMDVVTARDGFEAINAIGRKRPSLMLVDLEMPRMNGLELTAHLRSREDTRDIPVIMITSRSTDKHRTLALNAGVNTYLNKPWSEEDLLSCIQEQMAPAKQIA